jgi:hypothetical protein
MVLPGVKTTTEIFFSDLLDFCCLFRHVWSWLVYVFARRSLIISCDDLWTDHREKTNANERLQAATNDRRLLLETQGWNINSHTLASWSEQLSHTQSLECSKSVSPFTVGVSADVHKKHTQPKGILWTTAMHLLATILLPASADMLSIWQESQEEEDYLAKTQVAAIETTTRTTRKHSKIEQKWVHDRANLRNSCSSPLDRKRQKTP